eukprot:10110214-Karenia_brevis.AAC.1
MQLLERSGLVRGIEISSALVSAVLARLLAHFPNSISLDLQPYSSVEPLTRPGNVLQSYTQQWVPYIGGGNCPCGCKLVRWRSTPAIFFTLASGLLPGFVVFLRCFECKRVFGGPWTWDN